MVADLAAAAVVRGNRLQRRTAARTRVIVPVIMPTTNMTNPPKIAGSQPVMVNVLGIMSDTRSNASAGNIQNPSIHKGMIINRASPNVETVHRAAKVTDKASTAHSIKEKTIAKPKAALK